MEQLIIEKQYNGDGIGGEIHAVDYMCSILNFLPRLVPERTTSMQKHTETDECFILLQGKAMLVLADGEDSPNQIQVVKLRKNTIYNVPLGVWHTPIMSEDAKILLVENNHTIESNSPRFSLTEEQMDLVQELAKDF